MGAETPEEEVHAAKALRSLGGHVFLDLKSGRVGEINLSGNERVTDATLAAVASCSALTDLSLESTAVGDAGLARLAGLSRLEWLNLYRTRITDRALKTLGAMPSLTHLPLGETAVTDQGVASLCGLPKLRYLGLRGNRITDAASKELGKLRTLTGLHLGETGVSDVALPHLARLPKLEELWLHDTAVTDAGLRAWREPDNRPPALRRLHLQRTRTSAKAIEALRKAWPDCRIFWESDPESGPHTNSKE